MDVGGLSQLVRRSVSSRGGKCWTCSRAVWAIVPVDDPGSSAPPTRYALATATTFGIIASDDRSLCRTCDRTGSPPTMWYCAVCDRGLDLRAPLRAGLPARNCRR